MVSLGRCHCVVDKVTLLASILIGIHPILTVPRRLSSARTMRIAGPSYIAERAR